MENDNMTIKAAAEVFGALVGDIDAGSMTEGATTYMEALAHLVIEQGSAAFGAQVFAGAVLERLLIVNPAEAVEILTEYFDFKDIAHLAEPDDHHCPTCNDSGFSGYGSGYDAVCSDCGGQSAYGGAL